MLSGVLPPSIINVIALPILLTLTALIGWPFAAPSFSVLRISRGEKIFLCVVLGTVIVSWVGTLLAIMGFFHWPVLLGSLLVLGGAYFWLSRGPKPQTPQEDTASVVSPLYGRILVGLLFIFAAWLYARPAESFIVFDDAGLYTSSSIALASEGSLSHSVTDVDSQDIAYPDFVDVFCSFMNYNGGLSALNFGISRWAFEGQAEIAFLPIPKVWGAIMTWLLGSAYVPWIASLFGLLGLASVYFFAKHLFGWGTALGSATLLCISFPQFWFSRYFLSDTFAQIFIFGGLYLLTLSCRLNRRCTMSHHVSLFSALALSGLVLVRFEALLILPPLGMTAAFSWISWKAKRGTERPGVSHWHEFLAIFVTFGSLLALLVSRHYLMGHSLILLSMNAQMRFGVLALTGALTLAFYLWREAEREPQRQSIRLATMGRLLPYGLMAGWAILGALIALRTIQTGSPPHIFVWLGDYLRLPILSMGILGGLWLSYRERQSEHPELVGLLASTLVSLLVYSWVPLVNNAHPWAMRRLVVLVIPTLFLTASAAVAALLRDLFGSKGQLRFVVPASLVIWTMGCAVLLGQRTVPFIRYREYDGLEKQMRAFASSFADDALLLFNDDYLGLGSRIAPVTELAFQRPSLVIREQSFDESEIRTIDAVIEGALERERPVYLVTVNGHLGWRSDAWDLSWMGSYDFSFPRIAPALKHLPSPSDISQMQFWLDTYRIEPRAVSSSLLDAPLRVSVGPGSYPYLQEGFNGWEHTPSGVPFRWTTGEAHIAVPWPAKDLNSPANFRLLLDISSWRPSRASDPVLAVYAEGGLLFMEKLPKEKGRHTIEVVGQSVQNTGSKTLDICLLVDVWSPEAPEEEPDKRRLGLIFLGLDVVPQGTHRF